MKLEKWMVLCFLLMALNGLGFRIYYFQVPHWVDHFNYSSFWDYGYFLQDILYYLFDVFILIATFQLIIRKELVLIQTLKPPILFYTASQVLWFTFTLISTKYSYFVPANVTNWYDYVLFSMKFVVLGLIVIYFLKNHTPKFSSIPKPVSKGARFLNYFIDSIVIFSIVTMHIRMLGDGFILEDIAYFNESPYWYIFINLFMYYFILEVVFLQTIGKLHNNSIVQYEGNRFARILFRTLGRFIPFDALSFFGSKGFHDSVSKTTVVLTYTKQEDDSDIDHLLVEN